MLSWDRVSKEIPRCEPPIHQHMPFITHCFVEKMFVDLSGNMTFFAVAVLILFVDGPLKGSAIGYILGGMQCLRWPINRFTAHSHLHSDVFEFW